MNERNVVALCRIFCDATLKISWQEIQDDLQTKMQLRDAVRTVAERMASAGVLVPSTLTDEQGYEVGSQVDFTTMRSTEREAIEAGKVRAELERIASGKP